MKECKFKWWDEGALKWQGGESLYWDVDRFVTGIWNFEETHVVEVTNPNPIVIQYAGLKDVKGIELYEYDFVTLYKGSDCERSFCVGDILSVGFQITECILMDGDFEIIGNLYTNTELLEK